MAGGERHVSKGPQREGNTFSVVWKRVERNEVLEMGRNWGGGREAHGKGSCMPGQEIRNFTKNLLYIFSKLFFLYMKLG